MHQIPVVPFGPSHGITALGVPIDVKGGKQQGDAKWDKAVHSTGELLQKLRVLPDGQIR